MTTLKTILVGALAIAGITASFVIHSRSQDRLRVNDAALRQQDNRLSELKAEYQRLSNLLVEENKPDANDLTNEMTKLRSEAAALRKQIHEYQSAKKRHAVLSLDTSKPNYGTSSNSLSYVVSPGSALKGYDAELYRLAAGPKNAKISAVQNLSSAVRKFTLEHQGEFPTNLDQVASVFDSEQARTARINDELTKLSEALANPSEGQPRSIDIRDVLKKIDETAPDTSKSDKSHQGSSNKNLTSEFEIVFRGTLDDLTNVPEQAVVLIRERQPWPTPGGKWARLYVMANGEISVVESDDNFQSWEAAHVIPPVDK